MPSVRTDPGASLPFAGTSAALGHAALFVLVILPWLDPLASGPTPNVLPLVVSWACAVGALMLIVGTPGAMSREALGRTVAWAWVTAATLSASMGLAQYFGAANGWMPWVQPGAPGIAFGNLRQRNQLASLVAIGLASLLYLQVTQGERIRRALPFAASVMIAGLAATSSRIGAVELLALVAIALVWRRISAGSGVLVLAGYAGASVLLPWGLSRATHVLVPSTFARVADNPGALSCQGRIPLWSNVLHLIGEHPWLGWGWGQLKFAHFITPYEGERFCMLLDNAHNLPLQLAVELGVPIAVAFVVACAVAVVRLAPWREPAPARQLAWAVLLVIALHSGVEYPLWYGPFQMAALAAVLLLALPTQGLAAIGARAAVAVQLVGALLLAALAYAAWDYGRVSQLYLAPAQRAPAYREDAYGKVSGSWLFRRQVAFAELTTTNVTADNAAHLRALAEWMLHFSPEPSVLDRLLESLRLQGDVAEAELIQSRYRAAYPEEWRRHAAASAASAP